MSDTSKAIVLGTTGSLLATGLTWLGTLFASIPPVSVPIWLLVGAGSTVVAVCYYVAANDRPRPSIVTANKNFTCERVALDGVRFIDCDFDRTVLIFNGKSPFSLVRCRLTHPTFHFEKHAGVTAYVMSLMAADPTTKHVVDALIATAKDRAVEAYTLDPNEFPKQNESSELF